MKAVIEVGNKQYIVTKGDKIQVDRLNDGTEELELEPLMVFDDKTATVGTPIVQGAKVQAKVVEALVKGDKIRVIRFKAKKRVKKIAGHRQQYSTIEITSVTA